MTPRGHSPHTMNVLFCRVEGGKFATTTPHVNFLPMLNMLLCRAEKGEYIEKCVNYGKLRTDSS